MLMFIKTSTASRLRPRGFSYVSPYGSSKTINIHVAVETIIICPHIVVSIHHYCDRSGHETQCNKCTQLSSIFMKYITFSNNTNIICIFGITNIKACKMKLDITSIMMTFRQKIGRFAKIYRKLCSLPWTTCDCHSQW